jgi:hypothetical protein
MKKSMLLTLAAFSAALVYESNSEYPYIKTETEEEKKIKLEAARIKQYKAKGLVEFIYGSTSIWAINKKIADRKARKLNLLYN